MQLKLEEIAVASVVLNFSYLFVLEIILCLACRCILAQRVVHEKDLSLTKYHELLVTFQLDHCHKVGSFTN